MRNYLANGCLFLTLIMTCLPSWASEPADEERGISHSLVVYLLAPTIEGTQGIGPLDSDVSIDPGTVFENLEGSFLAGYFAEEGNVGFLADIIYMDLEADAEFANRDATLEIGNKQLIVNLAGTYRLSEHWRAMAGLVYTDLDLRLTATGEDRSASRQRDEEWTDPVVGLHYSRELSDRWSFAGFGQVGGFGVNADLVWQLTGSFSYQMTERTQLALGYRYIQFDYESGEGRDRFKFDVSQYGPAVGVRFNF